jgi:hypothetical protein
MYWSSLIEAIAGGPEKIQPVGKMQYAGTTHGDEQLPVHRVKNPISVQQQALAKVAKTLGNWVPPFPGRNETFQKECTSFVFSHQQKWFLLLVVQMCRNMAPVVGCHSIHHRIHNKTLSTKSLKSALLALRFSEIICKRLARCTEFKPCPVAAWSGHRRIPAGASTGIMEVTTIQRAQKEIRARKQRNSLGTGRSWGARR